MDIIKKCSDIERQLLAVVSLVIAEKEIEAYAIGGFVRDKILSRPCKDIDIVCVGNALELAEGVSGKLGDIPVHFFQRFGVAQLDIDGTQIEFTNARKESYSTDSRNPCVTPGTLEEDFLRRDFTVNAIAVSLNPNDYGNVLDPFNGMQHIERKVLVTPSNPEITFDDDPLRILRAIRFASQLGFSIEEKTWRALAMHTHRLAIVSRERIKDELNKMMLSSVPSVGFYLLDKANLWHQLIPEINELKGVEFRDGKGHKDNFHHTLQVVDNVAQHSGNLWTRWAALLHDIAKPKTKRFEEGKGWTFHGHDFIGSKMVLHIFKRLAFPLNEKMRFVQKLVALHLRPISLTKEETTDSAVRRLLHDAGEDIDELMILCESDITSKRQDKVKQYMTNFQYVRARMGEVEEKDKLRNFKLQVTGETIMREFNIPPCKQVGIIKEAILHAVLDGKIANTTEDTLRHMRAIADPSLSLADTSLAAAQKTNQFNK